MAGLEIRGLNEKQAKHWGPKFEAAHRQGPEAFALVWGEFVRAGLRRKGDAAAWNELTRTFQRFYADHCA
jgi:hypothetical protein